MVNNEYDYIRGNTAVKPKRKDNVIERQRERRNLEERRRERQRKEARQNKSIVMNILHVATVILILGVINIALDGRVYKTQKALTDLRNEIKIAKAEGEALRVNLLKNSSIEEIKEYAHAIGMKTPGKNDTVVITIKKNFFENIQE
ncbi:cell division protein FtsL [Caproiciproducens sp. MSJ-32]|uniref:cell division protein FtsL n=1 Tax=Caproiciproducens sp. MSJ-32 TaxID=2841527 RepID=UPI001C1044A9|nr:cell division protein FtsL [Caproiciproducens sp. MSJ-32]MBU5456197.1 cell division protein FtsL [Caproiciproducens sp. MSJ-32]